MRKKYIWVILVISVVFNVMVLSLDTVPFIWPKVQNKLFAENIIVNDNHLEPTVLKKSLEMVDSKDKNFWTETKGFTETIFKLYHGNLSKEFKIYNYPKAYLYYGLSTYLIKIKDSVNLEKVKYSFDKLLDDDGYPTFNLDKVDQIPFGLTALNLYERYGESKYLKFCDVLYEKCKEFSDENGIILYRQNNATQFSDVIGMVVPFLVEYGKLTDNPKAQMEAKKQLKFYVKYGVDKETYLPSHGINLDSKVKVGPSNWGRGIGWYFLGLSHYYKATGEFKKEFEGLTITLNKLRTEEGLWSQFPGSSEKFDASTSTIFIYCFNNGNELFNNEEMIDNLHKYISKDGNILQTSGDTYGINHYSTSFGKSELSQGFLLLLL